MATWIINADFFSSMDGVVGDKQVRIGGIGAVIAFLACMTPMLFLPMAFVGIGTWFAPLNKYIIFPAIGIFLIVLVHGIIRHFRQEKTNE